MVRTRIDDFNGHLSLTMVRALVNDRHVHLSSTVISVVRLSDRLYHDLSIIANIHIACFQDFNFYVLCLLLQFEDSRLYSII